ncbi:hypothetical protein F4778DRAFT_722823 [Xylariomycetidae sp. FL2044]|nr:hypothetical protein F4778DRAFT_722823 [Xylariomycetidae sp. FL2044]
MPGTASFSHETIGDLLSQQNPLLSDYSNNGRNTRNPDYVTVPPHLIDTWKDFTYDNILAAYGDILLEKVASDGGFNFHDSQGQNLTSEDCMDSIAASWNADVIRKPMKRGAEILQQRFDQPQSAPSFKQRAFGLNVLKTTLKHDWQILNMAEQASYAAAKKLDRRATPPRCFAVGDSKLSSKWTSRMLVPKKSKLLVPDHAEFLWPLRQIASYAYYFNTRYAFILTPIELVVFRVYSVDSPGKIIAGVQWKSISWSEHGSGKLTVNLALWALIMMGMNDNHRPIVSVAQLYPLNWWVPAGGETTTQRYSHYLSRRSQEKNKIDEGDEKARAFTLTQDPPSDCYEILPASFVIRRTSGRRAKAV